MSFPVWLILLFWESLSLEIWLISLPYGHEVRDSAVNSLIKLLVCPAGKMLTQQSLCRILTLVDRAPDQCGQQGFLVAIEVYPGIYLLF